MSAERYTWYDKQYSQPLGSLFSSWYEKIPFVRSPRIVTWESCFIASAKASPPLKTESQVRSTIGAVNCTSPCGSKYQVSKGLKSFLPGPIFVFLWKAMHLRSQK